MTGSREKIAGALQQGGNSSHREDRKDLKELQLFFFAVFVVLAVRCLHMIFSQLRSAARGYYLSAPPERHRPVASL